MRKDAVLTVRLLARTRTRLEVLARREGRSVSAQAERLIEQGMAGGVRTGGRAQRTRSLAGVLHGGLVPTLDDFRETRALVSAALLKRTRARDERRR